LCFIVSDGAIFGKALSHAENWRLAGVSGICGTF
jgi:hypothetical protein